MSQPTTPGTLNPHRQPTSTELRLQSESGGWGARTNQGGYGGYRPPPQPPGRSRSRTPQPPPRPGTTQPPPVWPGTAGATTPPAPTAAPTPVDWQWGGPLWGGGASTGTSPSPAPGTGPAPGTLGPGRQPTSTELRLQSESGGWGARTNQGGYGGYRPPPQPPGRSRSSYPSRPGSGPTVDGQLLGLTPANSTRRY
jgi:hypothetical protein